MKKPEIPKGQGVLFDETLVPADEFEKRRDAKMATPASVALQAGVEDDRREAGLEPRDPDRYVDQGTMSPDEVQALRTGVSPSKLAFIGMRQKIRDKYSNRTNEVPPPTDWGA